jgi:predicted ester cyclase
MQMTAQPQAQMARDAAALMRRWFEEVWNQGRELTIDEMFPRNSIMWGVSRPDASSRGPEEFRAFFQAMRQTFTGMHIDLEDVVQQDDMAYARFKVTATHSGDGFGRAATGKTITLVGMCCLKAADGVIVEGWNVWDQIGLARELGLLGAPALQMFP